MLYLSPGFLKFSMERNGLRLKKKVIMATKCGVRC
jgi:hypothetical protein